MQASAQELFRTLRAQYIEHGFPPHHAWTIQISEETDMSVLEELAEEGLVEPFTFGTYKLTDHAVKLIINGIQISPQADYLLTQLKNEYAKAGFPNHHAWAFSAGSDSDLPAFQELYSRGWIEPFTATFWRLTDAAVAEIVNEQPISDHAIQLLNTVRHEYFNAGQPHWRQWVFGAGDSNQTAFDELTTRGILERFSLGTWRLTPYGYQVITDKVRG